MAKREILLCIDAPHFYAGAVFLVIDRQWICFRAAPIIKYMIGWDSQRAKQYCLRKGWKFTVPAA